MRITTLETSVSVPFELYGDLFTLAHAPPEVQKHVAAGRLWHLVAWVDEPNEKLGLCHKGRCVHAPWPPARAVVGSLLPAKLGGYVALEVFPPNGTYAPLLLSSPHNEALASWLLSHQSELSSLFDCPVEVEDRGHDY